MKSKVSSHLIVLSVSIAINLLGCGSSGHYSPYQNPSHAAIQVQPESSREKTVSKPPTAAHESPSDEKKQQAAEAGLTKADLAGLWINEELERLLIKSRSIAGILQPKDRDWRVAVEFRGNNPNPVMTLNNHEGYNEVVELKDGELLCHGVESAKRKALHGKFVLVSRDGRRCIQYRRIPGIEYYIELPDGIVFCRPKSTGADDTEKYFRGLLAGRYALEPGGQPVVLHEDGRIEGLNGYNQYDVSFDFFDVHLEGDTGELIKRNEERTEFQWKWQGDRLMLYSVFCDNKYGCDYEQKKTGPILYVLRKTN
jgi:hypothetical protein